MIFHVKTRQNIKIYQPHSPCWSIMADGMQHLVINIKITLLSMVYLHFLCMKSHFLTLRRCVWHKWEMQKRGTHLVRYEHSKHLYHWSACNHLLFTGLVNEVNWCSPLQHIIQIRCTKSMTSTFIKFQWCKMHNKSTLMYLTSQIVVWVKHLFQIALIPFSKSIFLFLRIAHNEGLQWENCTYAIPSLHFS